MLTPYAVLLAIKRGNTSFILVCEMVDFSRFFNIISHPAFVKNRGKGRVADFVERKEKILENTVFSRIW